ncbi:MAG: hypothetical protein Q9209_000318 [Squamulea sp. 1 TL-2023]
MDDGRVKAFRTLKPPCVELSQAALRYKANKTTAKDLLHRLERLSETLHAVSHSLDAKLADYVFFPLSHVFSESKDLPPRLLEHALSCLRVLILRGWRDRLSSEVGRQLLILLAFLAGGSATDVKSKNVDEDVATIAYDCTANLFHSSVASSLGSHKTISPENIPLLSHAVTVILDGISNDLATKVRLAACTSLNALIDGIEDDEALRSFFPGIVSCLTKVLSSGIRSKTPWKLLQTCIQLLHQILCKILHNDLPFSVAPTYPNPRAVEKSNIDWVAATAGQVKVALSTVMPLRYHGRYNIREALFSLCLSVLTDCSTALANCTSMMLEALVVLSSQSAVEDNDRLYQRLQQVLAANPNLLDVLKDTLYDWTTALPRVVTSNDDTKQTRTLQQLSIAFRLLSAHDIDMKALTDIFASNLQSGVASAIQVSSTQAIKGVTSGTVDVSRFLQSVISYKDSSVFAPVVFNSTSQDGILSGLQMLIRQFDSSTMSMALQRSLTESLNITKGNEQIATLWLMLEFIRNQSQQDLESDQWLNVPKDQLEPLTEEAYSFSLEVLNKSVYNDTVDWRLQALSLEVVALQAKSQGHDFRPELVDALYPILERMGSSNAALQQHAVTCLGIVSNSCGYRSASELVVDNADYLVNAVAVKLNTFDISPQASQVMLMMVRLCGSTIIPYLDDLIESIFAILACYHGYPRLVESLFEVLNAVVEEGDKVSSRAVEPATRTTPIPRRPYKPATITDLVSRLHAMENKHDSPSSSTSPDPEFSTVASGPQTDVTPSSTTNEAGPRSKAHILIHTITQQTTHHLSTPSPPLRRLLLTLIASSLSILSPQSITEADNDTTFLPLIATLWPDIIRQILPSINSPQTDLPTLLTALQTLSTLSRYGGSFLLFRFSDLFPQIQTLYYRLQQDMLHEEKALGRSRASRSLKYKCWDAMVGLVVAIIEYVGITREMEDGVFEMLGGEALERGREGVKECLEGVNPDAVWLLEEETRWKMDGEVGRLEGEKPVLEGWEFRAMDF